MTISTSLRMPDAEVAVATLAREPGQLRQQRGLYRLEQQDRDAGDEQPGDELGRRGPPALGPSASMLAARKLAYDEQLGEHRAEQQAAERARELRVRRFGPGLDEAALSA